MKWYGLVVLFAATMVFNSFLYTVRLDYAGTDAIVARDFRLPDDALPVWNGGEEKLTAQRKADHDFQRGVRRFGRFANRFDA